MRVVFISDTHGRHTELGVLEGDVLVHCGDACAGIRGWDYELDSLDAWFGNQRFERIFCIAGNHDFTIEQRLARGVEVFVNATYLQDSSAWFGGRRFYGAPWTPNLQGWAFYADDGALRDRWSAIPSDTDVLITHTPPRDILDRSGRGNRLGCVHLSAAVATVRPAIHCFGHVHASYGLAESGGTRFVNAAMVNRDRAKLNAPVVVDLD